MFKKIILAFMLMLALSVPLSVPVFATVSSTNSRMDYTGNGSVSTYSYTYRIFSNTDLLVTVRDTSDVETTLTLTTDYTVTGVGSGSGGNVVLVNASQAWLTAGKLTTGYVLTIRRVRPLKQLTDIRNQGAFYPEIHEDAFDSLVMIAQQHQDEIDRSMKLPETIDPADFNTELPADLAANPSTSIIVNATGDGFAAGPTASAISGAQASATAAAASASSASTSASSASTSAAAAAAALAGATNFWGGTVGGTADAITLTPTPSISSYTTGATFTFLSTGTNTGAVTVAISGLTAKSIKAQSGAALTAGEITSGRVYTITYDGTNFSTHQLATPEDGVITNAKVNAAAAIAQSKIAAGGGILPSGAVYFMISGSCPTGTTDVSATYSNKFVKINATQGTSSGVVLTGTTDSHVLSTAEMPSHAHTFLVYPNANTGSTNVERGDGGGATTATTDSTGGGGGHTHTFSTASTLEPSSITMKACQVN